MNSAQIFRIKCRGLIVHDGKLLTVRHSPRTDGYYALPGGHLEFGEDPRACAERELFEELGIKPQVGRLEYVNTYTEGDIHYTEFFFEVTNGAEYLNYADKIRSHAHELYDIRWASPGDGTPLIPLHLRADFAAGTLITDEVRFRNDGTIVL